MVRADIQATVLDCHWPVPDPDPLDQHPCVEHIRQPGALYGVALFAQTGAVGQLCLFWIAPIVGGIIGAVIYKSVAEE